jgi:hypothetical protein
MPAGAPPRGDRLGSKRNLPMTQVELTVLRVVGLFLLVLFPLVHCLGWVSPGLSQPIGSPAAQEAAIAIPAPRLSLWHQGPAGARPDMRQTILSAVKSGQIEGCGMLGAQRAQARPRASPRWAYVVHWRQISGDGQGREILAALARDLDAGVVLPRGDHQEQPPPRGPISRRCRSTS